MKTIHTYDQISMRMATLGKPSISKLLVGEEEWQLDQVKPGGELYPCFEADIPTWLVEATTQIMWNH